MSISIVPRYTPAQVEILPPTTPPKVSGPDKQAWSQVEIGGYRREGWKPFLLNAAWYYARVGVGATLALGSKVANLIRTGESNALEPLNVRYAPSLPQPKLTRVEGSDGLPPDVRAWDSNHELFVDGDFALPDGGGVVRFEDLVKRDDFYDLLKGPIAFGQDAATDRASRPAYLHLAGLNTPLEDAVERCRDYAARTGLPLAQMLNGTTSDLGPLRMPAFLGTLELSGRGREWLRGTAHRVGDRFANILGATLRATIPSAERRAEFDRKWEEILPVNQRLRKNLTEMLLSHIERVGEVPHIVTLPYSESTVTNAHVLQDLEQRFVESRLEGVSPEGIDAATRTAKAQFERAKDTMTFATFGTVMGDYPQGFRTMHFFANGENPDQSTRQTGPKEAWYPWDPSKHGVRVNGTNVYLEYPQPFAGFEGHNMQAAGAVAIRAYLHCNGVSDLPELYDLAIAGKAKCPSPELLRDFMAMYRVHETVWFPDKLPDALKTKPRVFHPVPEDMRRPGGLKEFVRICCKLYSDPIPALFQQAIDTKDAELLSALESSAQGKGFTGLEKEREALRNEEPAAPMFKFSWGSN